MVTVMVVAEGELITNGSGPKYKKAGRTAELVRVRPNQDLVQ